MLHEAKTLSRFLPHLLHIFSFYTHNEKKKRKNNKILAFEKKRKSNHIYFLSSAFALIYIMYDSTLQSKSTSQPMNLYHIRNNE